MKHVGIDCRFAGLHAGLGRYTRELVTYLLRRDDPIKYTLFVQSENEEWLASQPSTFNIQRSTIPHYSLAEQMQFPKLIKQSGIDLLFSPHFNVPYFCPVPYVITIHDLILHRFPNNAGMLKQMAYRMLMKRSVQKANHVIAVSEFTAKELQDVYGALPNISVIHEGVNEQFYPRDEHEEAALRQKFDLQKPYFLYIGNAKEHKNVQMLIDAFGALQDYEKELILVTGGKEADNLRLESNVCIIADVSDADLPALYSGALAFVTASQYEGFGLPVIEAAACGCRVIATNGSAIAEVAGAGSQLVESIVENFVHAMKNYEEIEPVVERRFEWEDAAERTAELLLVC